MKQLRGKPFYVSDKCKNHRDCINDLACPAFFIEGENVKIDPDLCTGCAVCAQICPENAILPLKK
jgi:indolepyruvate ferredoxin oxidoreductase alpha subunit